VETLHSVAINSRGRITGLFRLEETSGGLLSDLLLQAGSAVGSDEVAQGFIQSGLENLPDCVTFLGSLPHCLMSSWQKSFSLYPVCTPNVLAYAHLLLSSVGLDDLRGLFQPK